MIETTQYILDAVKFAKEHFEHTRDKEQRCRYEEMESERFNFWAINARFGSVLIRISFDDGAINIILEGEEGVPRRQRAEIDAVMLTYESCKPGYPASDRRSKEY